ncbi:hypothetical protein PISMIDRAFT_8671 [Pisolithus microcarpus 441]|uniref:Protein-lysine N-methyltransferase EFM6 n=1 Tax=Pisolithus microcarpus 441 TaxID=765257 RepID=A0A0C9ZC64_9AGAM|nr:hypothetical protein BKA83DRAFT_8671 [Pisolithus microcarpus]KIK26891.1 hypothetical protein PISMIDRAFT_8671 [Pisolithus microcarpus 441]
MSGFSTSMVATDFYQSVLDNLRANIDRNFSRDPSDGTITSHFLDWSKLPAMSSLPEPLTEPFDVIIGADIMYKGDRAIWIKKCLEWLPHHTSTSPAFSLVATFHLVIPLRLMHMLEPSSIETAF